VPRLSGRVKLNKGVKTATEFVEFYPIVFITLSDAFSVVEHMESAFRYATQDDREKLDFQPDNDWIHNKPKP